VVAAGGIPGASAEARAEPASDVRQVQLGGLPGPYTLERWKGDWPGCLFEGGVREGRVSVVEGNGSKRLRVTCAPGEIGPERGGAGWRWPVGWREVADLGYEARFGEGFEFVKGGKLPGLCGGPENVSGGRPSDGRNGFSVRLMWRRDGRGEAYVYHKHQKGDYGDSFAFPDTFRFPVGETFGVRIRVGMNRPGERDGLLRVWIRLPGQEPELLVDRNDMEWRDNATYGVDSLYFEVFHGGGDRSWAPERACWVDFSDLRVGPPGEG
jgi:hypothetical protein